MNQTTSGLDEGLAVRDVAVARIEVLHRRLGVERNATGAGLAGTSGVVQMENALDHQPSFPEPANEFEMLPAEISAVGIVAHDAG